MTHMMLRMVHIIAGSLALAAALVALGTAKAGRAHRLAGQCFVASGIVVVVSALVSSAWGVVAIGSFIGDEVAVLDDQEIAAFRLFVAMLGVLALLAANDLDVGLASLGKSRPRVTSLLLTSLIAAGATLGTLGLLALREGRGGFSWFALAVGVIAAGEGWKRHQGTSTTANVVGHFTGMIGAASAFLAAFALFGAGRIVDSFDILDGGIGVLVLVVAVIGAGQLLTGWWKRRPDQPSIPS